MGSIFREIEEIPLPNEVEFDQFDLSVVSIKLFGHVVPDEIEQGISDWFCLEYNKTLSNQCFEDMIDEASNREWDEASEAYERQKMEALR
jgi:hypothetical protein